MFFWLRLRAVRFVHRVTHHSLSPIQQRPIRVSPLCVRPTPRMSSVSPSADQRCLALLSASAGKQECEAIFAKSERKGAICILPCSAPTLLALPKRQVAQRMGNPCQGVLARIPASALGKRPSDWAPRALRFEQGSSVLASERGHGADFAKLAKG